MQLKKYLTIAFVSMTMLSGAFTDVLAADIGAGESIPQPTVRPVSKTNLNGPIIAFEDAPGNDLLATMESYIGDVAIEFTFKKLEAEKRLVALEKSLVTQKDLYKEQRETLFPEITKDNLTIYLYWIAKGKGCQKESFDLYKSFATPAMQELLGTYITDSDHKDKVDRYLEIYEKYLKTKKAFTQAKEQVKTVTNALSFCHDLPLWTNRVLNKINENPHKVILRDLPPFIEIIESTDNIIPIYSNEMNEVTAHFKTLFSDSNDKPEDSALIDKVEYLYENISGKYKRIIMQRRQMLKESFFNVLKAFQAERKRQRAPFDVISESSSPSTAG